MLSRRNAHTLFEVVTVIGVIVVVSLISIPLIQPMLSSNHVQAASDLVRARWSEARARAIAEGRPYRFAYKENTGSFRVAPEGSDYWADGEPSRSSSATMPALVKEDNLPGKVTFPHGSGTVSGDWTVAATFLPDGTAQDDAEIVFSKGGIVAMTLRLQARTGAITSAEPEKGP